MKISISTLNPEAKEKTKDIIDILNQKLKEKYGQFLVNMKNYI